MDAGLERQKGLKGDKTEEMQDRKDQRETRLKD